MKTGIRITTNEPHPHLGPLISSYQDGLTEPHETEMVERHLLECERCQAFYTSLQQARELINELPERSVAAQESDTQWLETLNRTIYHSKKRSNLSSNKAKKGSKDKFN